MSIALSLAILANHDEWRGVSRLKGECQIQQDKRIRVPMVRPSDHVEHDPDCEYDRLHDDEAPRAHRSGDRVRYALAGRKPRSVLNMPVLSVSTRHGLFPVFRFDVRRQLLAGWLAAF